MSDAPVGGDQVLLLYDELRKLAAARLTREAVGHTLNPTALVHEAYLKLGGARFADRNAFFGAAAVAMQRILIDHARRKKAGKRGGGARPLPIDADTPVDLADPDLLLDLGAALSRLSAEDPTCAEVARLRLFLGLSVEEAAATLGISRATAFREWSYARSWLVVALRQAE